MKPGLAQPHRHAHNINHTNTSRRLNGIFYSVRLAAVAERQWGRVTWSQLCALGVPRKTISDWKTQGYLHLIVPGVYAVGHRAPSYEADVAAALLYAGPGAALSHITAAHWLPADPPGALRAIRR